ncbi:MAG TPA: DUF4350 domain-containing protein [Caldimonas sp.]|nr:DUF4350 domain-containing protein [Caldimonas sp.]
MTRGNWLATALAALLLAAVVAWFMRSVEWIDVDVRLPAKGDAARDRFYVAKQLAQHLGAAVTTVHNLERLPPPGATLLIGSHRWNMFPGREAALRRWVDEGGHLVVLQSAWSAEGETPDWVPMRSVRPSRRDASARAGSAAVASAAAPTSAGAATSAGAPTSAGAATPAVAPTSAAGGSAALAVVPGHCPDFVEPDAIAGAFGAPRHYRVCGLATRTLRADAPTWLLAGRDGVVAARVPYGRGDITANALEGSFGNGAALRDDGAFALAAILRPQPGSAIWFFDEESRARFLAVLWDHGAPALLLAAAAIALLLWRGGTRFGPLLAEAPRARRSIGEQVRRTAAFIAAGGGAALHRAGVRALEEEARRSIANYAGLLGARERSEAIARTTHGDPVSLAAAMSPLARFDRHSLAAAIGRLERARRALLPDRRRSLQRLLSSDSSPS